MLTEAQAGACPIYIRHNVRSRIDIVRTRQFELRNALSFRPVLDDVGAAHLDLFAGGIAPHIDPELCNNLVEDHTALECSLDLRMWAQKPCTRHCVMGHVSIGSLGRLSRPR